MRYIKLFEDKTEKEIQYEEICSIFTELIDEELADVENKENSINVYISKDSTIEYAENIKGLDSIKDSYRENLSFLDRISVLLKRVDYHGYEWTMNIYNDSVSINISHIDHKLSLYDAFGGESYMRTVDIPIMKKVCKNLYDLNFIGWSERPATSGYYGNSHTITLSFANLITPEDKIVSDIKSLKKNSGSRDAFYSVSISTGPQYSSLTIKVN